MNTKTILRGTVIVLGLTSLGLLAWYVYGTTETDRVNQMKPKAKMPVKRPLDAPLSKSNATPKPKQEMPQGNPLAKRDVMPRPIPTSYPIADEFPLRLGSTGRRVERLQVWLMRNYGWTGLVSDVFDLKTQVLLKKYLKRTELDRDTYQRMKMDKPVREQVAIR